jgi:hypothetical protein
MWMKRRAILVSLMVLAGLAILGVSCSTLTECVTSSHLTWGFVQAVGGIKVGDPRPVAAGEWAVPVECDVSGLTTVTTKPTTVNSAWVVRDVRWKARKDVILVWVVACVATDRHSESHWTRSITLKGVKPGRHAVRYLNPDGSMTELRSIELHE